LALRIHKIISERNNTLLDRSLLNKPTNFGENFFGRNRILGVGPFFGIPSHTPNYRDLERQND